MIKKTKPSKNKITHYKKSLLYTVLMSVYSKEDPDNLSISIKSMLAQTLLPDEILILQDGPLTPELDNVLNYYNKKHPEVITLIKFKKRRGLGPILADGINMAKNNIIARMDSDDISHPNRCKLQSEYFNSNNNYDIVGCSVTEFMDKPENIVTERKMPENHEDIIAYSHKRNPFAHPSVMFRRDKVLAAGNYRDYKLCEDYDLWVRMINNGSRCYNIQEHLVNMRLSPDFYARRGGLTYVKGLLKFKKELLEMGYYSKKDFLVSAASTTLVGLAPNQVRGLLYARMLHSHKQLGDQD